MQAMTSSMPRAIRRFGRDRRGVSAVEFAFIAPVMIGLYLGCVEISDGVGADRKVSLTAAALANLTAQATDHQHRRHEQYSRRIERDHRALFGRQSEDDGVLPEHRRQQEREGEMERHAQRHGDSRVR